MPFTYDWHTDPKDVPKTPLDVIVRVNCLYKGNTYTTLGHYSMYPKQWNIMGVRSGDTGYEVIAWTELPNFPNWGV